jgi:hypothetical protein
LGTLGADKLDDGVGGALDCAGRAETLADFGEVVAERCAGALVVQQTKDFGGYAGGSEIVLDELGYGALAGD